MTDKVADSSEEIEHRLNAIERNVKWLREEYRTEPEGEVLERVKMIEADAVAISRAIHPDNPKEALGEHIIEKYVGGGRDE